MKMDIICQGTLLTEIVLLSDGAPKLKSLPLEVCSHRKIDSRYLTFEPAERKSHAETDTFRIQREN